MKSATIFREYIWLVNTILRGTIGGHTKQVKKHTEALDYLLRNDEYILHVD